MNSRNNFLFWAILGCAGGIAWSSFVGNYIYNYGGTKEKIPQEEPEKRLVDAFLKWRDVPVQSISDDFKDRLNDLLEESSAFYDGDSSTCCQLGKFKEIHERRAELYADEDLRFYMGPSAMASFDVSLSNEGSRIKLLEDLSGEWYDSNCQE